MLAAAISRLYDRLGRVMKQVPVLAPSETDQSGN